MDLAHKPYHCCSVAAAAAIHRLPLPDASDPKEKFDLGATAQVAELVVRETGSELVDAGQSLLVEAQAGSAILCPRGAGLLSNRRVEAVEAASWFWREGVLRPPRRRAPAL